MQGYVSKWSQNYLKVQDGDSCDRRKRDGGDRPHKVTHGVPHFHLGIAGKAPQQGVDQGLGHILLHLLRGHGEVGVLVVVEQNVPDHLVQHRE